MGAAARCDPFIRYFVLDSFLALPQNPDRSAALTRGDREGGDTMAKKKAAKKKKKK